MLLFCLLRQSVTRQYIYAICSKLAGITAISIRLEHYKKKKPIAEYGKEQRDVLFVNESRMARKRHFPFIYYGNNGKRQKKKAKGRAR